MLNIAIMTMVYNEAVNLPIWYKYYSKVVSPENLIILDHGSTDGSVDGCLGASTIHLPRKEWDNRKRATLINSLTKGLFGFYDAVVFCDADELLVPDLEKYEDLRDWIERNQGSTKAAIGLNVFHDYHTEEPLNLRKPILEQRKYAYFRSSLSKPLILFEPADWGLGCHHISRDHGFADDLFLIHLRFMDKDQSLSRLSLTRSMEWSTEEYKLNPNHYQRVDDEVFMKSFADGRVNYVRHKVAPFEFSEHIEKLRNSKHSDGRMTYFDLGVSGLPVVMPDWMRNVV
jgi:hypothetical protein